MKKIIILAFLITSQCNVQAADRTEKALCESLVATTFYYFTALTTLGSRYSSDEQYFVKNPPAFLCDAHRKAFHELHTETDKEWPLGLFRDENGTLRPWFERYVIESHKD